MRFAVFPDYTPKVARTRKRLRDVEGVRYSFLYPARLRIAYNGTQHLYFSRRSQRLHLLVSQVKRGPGVRPVHNQL
ncbi:hypothetical protein AOLI_G00054210 [Acnodon oligacanthus]